MHAPDETSIPLRLAERMAVAGERGADAAETAAKDVHELRVEEANRWGELRLFLARVEPVLGRYDATLKAEGEARASGHAAVALAEQEQEAAQIRARTTLARIWTSFLELLERLEARVASPKGLLLIAIAGPVLLQRCGVPLEFVDIAKALTGVPSEGAVEAVPPAGAASKPSVPVEDSHAP